MTWSPQWSVVTRGQGTLSRCATMQERTIWDSDAHAIQVAKECVFISGSMAMPRLAVMMAANPQLVNGAYVKSVQDPVGNGANGDDGTWYPNPWYCLLRDGSKAVQTSPHNYVMESGLHPTTHATRTRNGPLSGSSITGSYWAEYHIKDCVAAIAQTNAQAAQAGTHPLRSLWFDSEMLNSPQGVPGFFGGANPGINPATGNPYTTTDFIAMATYMGDVARNQVLPTINPERLWIVANGLQAGTEICAHNDMVMYEGVFVNNGWKAPPTGQSISAFESRCQRLIDAQLVYGCVAEPEEVGAAGWSTAQQNQARRFSAGVNLMCNRGLLTFEYGDTQSTAPHLETPKDTALYGDLTLPSPGTTPPLDLGLPLTGQSPATAHAHAVAVGTGNGQASATGLYARLFNSGTVLINPTGLDGSAGTTINYKASKSYTLVPYPAAGGASYVAGNLIAVPPKSAVLLTTSGGSGGTGPSDTYLPALIGTPREGQAIRIEQGEFSGSPAPTVGDQVQLSADGSTGWADIAGEIGPVFVIPFGSGGTPSTYAADNFSDTEVDTWANAGTGGAWTVEQGNPADFDKTSGKGTFSHSAANTGKIGSLNIGQADADAVVTISFTSVPAGGNMQASLILRFQDTNNYLRINLVLFATGGHVFANPDKVISNVATSLGSSKDLGSYTAGAGVKVRLRLEGTNLKAKAWVLPASEPGSWDWDVTDSSITAAGKVAIRSYRGAGNTNTSPQTKVDDLVVSSLVGTVAGLVTEYLSTHETGANSAGTTTVRSAALGPIVAGSPTDPIWDPNDLPSISGIPAEGSILTCDPGTVPGATFAYQWETSSTKAPGSESNVSGEIASTHTPASGTAGAYRRCDVAATIGGVTVHQKTPWLGPLVATDTVPSFSVNPAITGVTEAGETLTLTLGTPAGSPVPAVGTPQWQRSTDGILGVAYEDIPGENGLTYAEQAGDAGSLIRAGVPLSSRAGNFIGYSDPVGPVTLPTSFPDLQLQVSVE
jgi:hypothetical protein